jgi:hypothetical protein
MKYLLKSFERRCAEYSLCFLRRFVFCNLWHFAPCVPWKGRSIDLPARIHRKRAVPNPEPEINAPLNPPPIGTDVVVAAQMQQLQQMANTMAEMQAQIC